MDRGKGVGTGWRWAKGEEMGTSVIVSTIKTKKKRWESLFLNKTRWVIENNTNGGKNRVRREQRAKIYSHRESNLKFQKIKAVEGSLKSNFFLIQLRS